jgi:hypothetical protein
MIRLSTPITSTFAMPHQMCLNPKRITVLSRKIVDVPEQQCNDDDAPTIANDNVATTMAAGEKKTQNLLMAGPSSSHCLN